MSTCFHSVGKKTGLVGSDIVRSVILCVCLVFFVFSEGERIFFCSVFVSGQLGYYERILVLTESNFRLTLRQSNDKTMTDNEEVNKQATEKFKCQQ